MHKPDIYKLVSAYFMPNRPDVTTQDFRTWAYRNLVPEIHDEVLRFYGSADSPEALHPGLDYAHPAHRLRLSAFPRHTQLFAVFDQLRLTKAEIQALCTWDGTKHAREKYERRTGTKIVDTTWHGVHDFEEKKRPTARLIPVVDFVEETANLSNASDALARDEMMADAEEFHSGVEDEDDEDEDEDDEDVEADDNVDPVEDSVGLSLHDRLVAATEARERGENVPMDADWEQWMKEALERGIFPEQPPSSLPRLASTNTAQPQLVPVFNYTAPTSYSTYRSLARPNEYVPARHTEYLRPITRTATSAARRAAARSSRSFWATGGGGGVSDIPPSVTVDPRTVIAPNRRVVDGPVS